MRHDDKKEALIQKARLLYARYEECPLLAQLFVETLKKTQKSKLGGTNTPLTEADFNRCLDLLLQQKDHDDLPNAVIDSVDIQYPGYHIVKLPINDPRAFILGKITHCCQSINGHAQQCVIDGWTKPNSGFYVLLKENKKNKNAVVFNLDGSINYDDYHIVGQSYAWLSIFGNLVFSAWIFLKHETQTLEKAKLLKAYAEKIVSDPSSCVYRVMIGRNTHIPYPNEFKKDSVEKEKLHTGPAYCESTKQIEIACFDLNLFKLKIADAAEKLPLSLEEKKLLCAYAPSSIRYPDLLIACTGNSFLFEKLKMALDEIDVQKKIMLLRQLTVLYISFSIPIIQKTFYFLDTAAVSKKCIKTIDSDSAYLAQTLILLENAPLLPTPIIKIIHDEFANDSNELSFLAINNIVNFLKVLQEIGFDVNEHFYFYALKSLRYALFIGAFDRFESEERAIYSPFIFFIRQLNQFVNAGFELTADILEYASKLNTRAVYPNIEFAELSAHFAILKLKNLIENHIELNEISLAYVSYEISFRNLSAETFDNKVEILKKIQGISFKGDPEFISCFKAVLIGARKNDCEELDCLIALEKAGIRLNKETLAKIESDTKKKILPEIKKNFDLACQAGEGASFIQSYVSGPRLFNAVQPTARACDPDESIKPTPKK